MLGGKLGWDPAKLNEPIRGKRRVIAETAIDHSQALKISPELCQNLPSQQDSLK